MIFFSSLSPKHYIITESRPPEKESHNKYQNKSTGSDGDKQIENELKLLGK